MLAVSSRTLAALQGAQVMSSHGVNVPPGVPAFSLDEVQKAADEMANEDGEARHFCYLPAGFKNVPL